MVISESLFLVAQINELWSVCNVDLKPGTLVNCSFKIFQHTSHNVGIFAKRFARIFLRLQQLQIDGKTVTIATENVDFMDLTDTNPENNC